MRNIARISLLVVALAVTGSVWAADSAPTAATGGITGRVVDASGKPVAGAHVVAFAPERVRDGKDGANKEKPRVALPHREPVAKTESGADGTFTLNNIPAGKVRVVAGIKGVGLGMTREPVIVKAGETAQAGDIELKKHVEGKGPKAGEAPKAPQN